MQEMTMEEIDLVAGGNPIAVGATLVLTGMIIGWGCSIIWQRWLK